MKLHEELAADLEALKSKHNLNGYIFIFVRGQDAGYVKQTKNVFHSLLGAMRQVEFEALIEKHDEYLIMGKIDV